MHVGCHRVIDLSLVLRSYLPIESGLNDVLSRTKLSLFFFAMYEVQSAYSRASVFDKTPVLARA